MAIKPTLFMAATMPLLVLTLVWQQFTFSGIEEEINVLEKRQYDWFEENKRLIIGIEYLSSPERINQIAENELNLVRGTDQPRVRVEIVSSGSLSP